MAMVRKKIDGSVTLLDDFDATEVDVVSRWHLMALGYRKHPCRLRCREFPTY